jgi:hypothetical protein
MVGSYEKKYQIWILYEDCLNGKWKCNLVDLEQWFDISTIFFSFLAWKNTTNKSQINILAATNLWRISMTFEFIFLTLNVSCVIWFS